MQVRQSNMEQNMRGGGENSLDILARNVIPSMSEKMSESSKPVDVSSRVWRLFLDSKCSSATVFFKLHLSARTYFRSPTPWNPGSASNLSTKVAKLLDSFRPGSSSYSPFQSKSDENNNESNQNNANHESENINGGLQLLRPSVLTQRVMEESNSAATLEDPIIVEERNDPEGIINQGSHQSSQNLENIQNSNISPEEQNRRRLYLNLGRPRPFYRVPSENDQNESGRKLTESKIHKKKGIGSLKEEAKNQIVAMYGLKSLAKILNECSPRLPETIKNFLFTFPCHDFEEDGCDRPPQSASYNVQCQLDSEKYTAIFATSEADKAVGNLWEDEKDWLRLTDPGVTQILAIAVDPLTENIFYIIPERGHVLTEVINTCSGVIDMGDGEKRKRQDMVEIIGKSVIETLKRLSKKGLSYGPLKEENIFLCHGQVLLENQLMVKPSSPCNCTDVDHPSGFYASENLRNLHKLGLILARLLNCDGKTPVGQAGCGGLEEALVEENLENVEHSVGKLVRQLLTAPQNFVH
eukprot:GFUD01012064.1.p1 GENE.GFUD01012064.1~~GFUD01012064.1.p1  ORF type:complete len:524 (+),score=132.20 GFUD01012064.1:388-1959(+)